MSDDAADEVLSVISLGRPYRPPELYVFEEVEIGGGYHTLSVCSGPERDWFGPYRKSGVAQYLSRVVKVEYPPRSI